MLMKKDKVDLLIEELIQISLEKINYIKINKDTLSKDIVFLNKYEELKEILDIQNLSDISVDEYPNIVELKEVVLEINKMRME